MTTLAQKIKKARLDSKLSQLQAGVDLGVSDKTISGYESGRICPPVDKLQQLAELYKKPITYFLDDDPKNYKISSRLRAVEVMLREIRQELREIKILSQKHDID